MGAQISAKIYNLNFGAKTMYKNDSKKAIFVAFVFCLRKKFTCKSDVHFRLIHLQPNRSIRICNTKVTSFQKSLEEKDSVAAKTATFQIPPWAWHPCSSGLDCVMSLHPIHPRIWKYIQNNIQFI